MDFTPGTGATFEKLVTLEQQVFGIVRMVQSFEGNSINNPNEQVSLVTSSLDEDVRALSGSFSIPVLATPEGKGVMSYSIQQPFPTLPPWSEGEGGQGKSSNWVEALAERFLALAFHERDQEYNPESLPPRITDVSWKLTTTKLFVPIEHNCLLGANFSLPYTTVILEGQVTELAEAYLDGSYPDP